ncbi:MAG: PD40 domain-containing protein, partial [Planctomycetes bacterium]|nr:PD40 domain-containing protein [Planctomycetota bacterium]
HDHGSPRWSHDGKRLVFDAGITRHGPRTCFVVHVDGTGLGELCKGRLPDWSPDDQQIAFQEDVPGGGLPAIYVQNLDGKGRAKIAEGYSPRWSPDGSRLALSDRQMLRVLDLLSGEETGRLVERFGVVFNGFAWSPDGKRLAVAVAAKYPGPRELLVVDAAGDKRQVKPRLRNQLGGLISFSPDGKQIVFSNAFQLRIVDVEGGAPPRLVPGQEGQNRYPAWSHDGKWIAFTSTRKSPQPAPAKKAATPRGRKLQEIKRHTKGTIAYGLAFPPDGRRLVLGCDPRNTGVQVWDVSTGETTELGGRGIRIQMFPDGRRFATTWHSPKIQIVDLESGKVLREMEHGTDVWALSVSKDGKRILSTGLDKVARIWDAQTGQQLCAFDGHTDWITRAAFSPDGKEALTIGHDQTLRVWDTETGKNRLVIKHPAAIWGLAVTPDGRHILTGTGGSLTSSLTVLKIAQGTDRVLRVWDSATGKLVREMKGHTHTVYTIDVSPDGRLAVTGGWDGTMRLWDLATGDELDKKGPGKGRVAHVAFSPDGKLIVAGGGARRIAGAIVEFPNEQVRLYKIVKTARAGAL